MSSERDKHVLTMVVATLIRQSGGALPTRSSERARFEIDPKALLAASDGFNLDEWYVDVDINYATRATQFTLRPVMGGFGPLMDERRMFAKAKP